MSTITPLNPEMAPRPDMPGQAMSSGKAMKQTSKTAAELDRPEAPSLDAATTPTTASQPDGGHNPDAGETHWSQASGNSVQEPVPKQPTERDESASSQAPASAAMDAIGSLAFQDAVTGVDTDRGPVLDAVYNGPVTEGERTGDAENARGERDSAKSTSSNKR